MESLFHFMAPPGPCGYLPEQTWTLEYDIALTATAKDYEQRMEQGWRRFGRAMFRPQCESCRACEPIRIVVERFQPDRSQRRVRQLNEGVVQLRIGQPKVSKAKLDLYDRYHTYQAGAKGWPEHPAKDPESYANSYIENPFPTEEWCYYHRSRLVGVGYVDSLPRAMSGIYFFYDPDHRQRSLGTWNILCMLEEATKRGIPHLYLGYYVAKCQSMLYKARFLPCEVRGVDGVWRDFGKR